MATTFVGEQLPCAARRQGAPPRPARRSTHTPMPAAWQVLLHERCGCAKALTWDAWQAVASSRWSAARALRQQFLLFAHCPATAHDLARHGVKPRQNSLYEIGEISRPSRIGRSR